MRKPLNLAKQPHFIIIIRATYCRGDDQTSALAELDRRGLWLTADMKKAAGVA